MAASNASVFQLDRDGLIREVLRLQAEKAALEERLRAYQSGAAKPRVNYNLSMSVLTICGKPEARKCRPVPLDQYLNRTAGREDQREGDTPVVFNRDANFGGRLSVDNGRLSEYSVGAGSDGSPDGRPSMQLLEGRPSVGPMQTAPQQLAGRPAMLQLGGTSRPQLRLDPDAIVSTQTLQRFAEAYHGQPLSPQSSYATSTFRYLMDDFARTNKFTHKQQPQLLEAFGRTLINLCNEVENILKREEFHVSVASPCFVFGDIHGNFKDLHYFMTTLVNFEELKLTPSNLVFLGDYVDRGEFGVEVVALLFALKALAPGKVTLLRGNHEDTLVNGDLNLYRDTSFRHQCYQLFDRLLGEEVWKRCNRVFSFLPLTANIDQSIFCTHGGLPRYRGGDDERVAMLMRKDFPKFESFFQIPEHEPAFHTKCRQIASDVCWSDPAEDESSMDEYGFGPNPRGNGVILFGSNAVDKFLADYNFQFIFRAHQEKSDGLKISKNARVVTIFSTSAYVGHENGAGVVFVGDGKIRLIVKQPDE